MAQVLPEALVNEAEIQVVIYWDIERILDDVAIIFAELFAEELMQRVDSGLTLNLRRFLQLFPRN